MATYTYLAPSFAAPPIVSPLLQGSTPVITIGIPVYNPPKAVFPFIMRSLIAFAERYPAVEILLHDDASPDPEIVPLLKEWQQKYPQWIKLQLSPKNQGIHAARQAMVEAAAGRYFLSNDNDDLLLCFDAEREIAFLDAHPEISATYPRRYLYRPETLSFLEPTDFPASDLFGLCAMMQSTNGALIRTSMLRACGGYSGYDDVEDDVGLYYKLILQGPTVLRNEPRVLVRCHEERGWSRGTPETRRVLVSKLLIPYAKETALLEQGEIPDLPPRMAAALTGGLLLLQKLPNPVLLTLCRKLSVLCPGDLGCRALLLDLLAAIGNWDEWDAVAGRAMEDFRSDPAKTVALFCMMQSSQQRFFQRFPAEIREAHLIFNRIPAGLPETLRKLLEPQHEN